MNISQETWIGNLVIVWDQDLSEQMEWKFGNTKNSFPERKHEMEMWYYGIDNFPGTLIDLMKLWNFETKKPSSQGTKKQRNEETRNQETKKCKLWALHINLSRQLRPAQIKTNNCQYRCRNLEMMSPPPSGPCETSHCLQKLNPCLRTFRSILHMIRRTRCWDFEETWKTNLLGNSWWNNFWI